MNERAKEAVRADPVIDRSSGITAAGRLVVLAFGLVGLAIGWTAVGLAAVSRFPALARVTTFMLTVYFVLAVAFLVWDWRRPAPVAAAGADDSDMPADEDNPDTPAAEQDDYVPEDD